MNGNHDQNPEPAPQPPPLRYYYHHHHNIHCYIRVPPDTIDLPDPPVDIPDFPDVPHVPPNRRYHHIHRHYHPPIFHPPPHQDNQNGHLQENQRTYHYYHYQYHYIFYDHIGQPYFSTEPTENLLDEIQGDYNLMGWPAVHRHYNHHYDDIIDDNGGGDGGEDGGGLGGDPGGAQGDDNVVDDDNDEGDGDAGGAQGDDIVVDDDNDEEDGDAGGAQEDEDDNVANVENDEEDGDDDEWDGEDGDDDDDDDESGVAGGSTIESQAERPLPRKEEARQWWLWQIKEERDFASTEVRIRPKEKCEIIIKKSDRNQDEETANWIEPKPTGNPRPKECLGDKRIGSALKPLQGGDDGSAQEDVADGDNDEEDGDDDEWDREDVDSDDYESGVAGGLTIESQAQKLLPRKEEARRWWLLQIKEERDSRPKEKCDIFIKMSDKNQVEEKANWLAPKPTGSSRLNESSREKRISTALKALQGPEKSSVIQEKRLNSLEEREKEIRLKKRRLKLLEFDEKRPEKMKLKGVAGNEEGSRSSDPRVNVECCNNRAKTGMDHGNGADPGGSADQKKESNMDIDRKLVGLCNSVIIQENNARKGTETLKVYRKRPTKLSDK